ncbi:hypothetical protein Syun_000857 [Stephania yunnanensis]|uniref:Uncharacterized protein n=1 Tax=Stephania yunnanensis TaxID=152371 RepID=A0AAP0LCM0_9MAGN
MGLPGFRHSPLHLCDTWVMRLRVISKNEIMICSVSGVVAFALTPATTPTPEHSLFWTLKRRVGASLPRMKKVHMACYKEVITGEETGSELLGSARSRGGQRSHTASYLKEKQKTDTNGNAPATSRRGQKGVLQNEVLYVTKHQERDLIIARDRTEGETFESSEDLLGNDEKKKIC